MRDVFISTLSSLAATDPKVFLITGDLGFGVLDEFSKRFPRQFLNVGVAEQNMTGIAAGLSRSGRVVFTYSIGNFPTLRCLEQVRNDVCYHNANVKIVSIGGGFSYGSLGISHHATEDIAIMRAIPNMTCFVPSDDEEVEAATHYLVNAHGPAFLRLDKMSLGCQDGAEVFQPGKLRRLLDGDDVTIISAGGVMKQVLAAAELLSNDGVSCRVFSMHSPHLIDEEAIRRAVTETKGLVTVEEHSVVGGIGGAVAEFCVENRLMPKFFKRIGLRRAFTSEVGDQSYLQERVGLSADSIRDSLLDALRGA